MSALERAGVFKESAGRWWTCRWKRGTAIAGSLGLRLEGTGDAPRRLRLTYTIAQAGQRKVECEYLVPVEFILGRAAAGRWRFRCGLERDGRGCRRPCDVLYLRSGARYFGCRPCHRLNTAIRLSAWEIALRAARCAETELTGASSIDSLARGAAAVTRARAVLYCLARAETEEDRRVDELMERMEAKRDFLSGEPTRKVISLLRGLHKAQARELTLLEALEAIEGPETLTVEVSLAAP